MGESTFQKAMNLSGKAEQVVGTISAWVLLIVAIKEFYEFEYLLKMNGNNTCKKTTDDTDCSPEEGVRCCDDYHSSLFLYSDSVIMRRSTWDACQVDDKCTLPSEGDEGWYECLDVDGWQMTSVKSPIEGVDEHMALSGNIAFQIVVWLAVVGYMVSESFLIAVGWGVIDNPTADMNYGKHYWTAFSHLLKWFWIFPTVLITNTTPPGECLSMAPIGSIDTGYMVVLSFGWMSVFMLVLLAMCFVQYANASAETMKDCSNYIFTGVFLMVCVSTFLGLYTQIMSVVETVAGMTLYVFISMVVSEVGHVQQIIWPLNIGADL